MDGPHGPRADKAEEVKLSDAASFLLDECRTVLPGIQALFGFQLIAVFNQRFADELSPFEQRLHFGSMALVALAATILMTPAAYHRLQGVTLVTGRFLRNSSRLLLASMVPLSLGLATDVYLIARLIFGEPWVAAVPAVVIAVMAFFWFVFPLSERLQAALDRLPLGRKATGDR